MDEPESLAAVAMAGREKLANLTFVVNCNLQRLDGPVRGNGKVIQELEGLFAGAGWNVVKVVWAREWDPLLAADVDGVLLDKMNTTLDGEYQKYRVESGAFIRERFFGPDPRLTGLVAHLSDDDLRRLRRGGHDPKKVYAAYRAAVEHTAGPTVVLAKTVKGWALGPDVEARNATHQIKKLTEAELRVFRDRLELPIPDRALADDLPPYAHPGFDSEEYRYLAERRRVLGGPLPARRSTSGTLAAPEDKVYEELLAGTGPKVAASTTGAFTRLLRGLLRDPHLGRRVVPIVPDEARTFGIDGLFREVGIYQPGGQRYEPVDAGLLLSYHEAPDGQILEEGITEAGAMASTLAAGTSYAALGEATVPFFVHYSMFGFHRAADLLWAFGDARGRGFVLAATAGRTTLQGEGLQHCDGQSLLYASAHPSCRAYDPAFAYEVAVIVRAGVAAMYGSDPEDVFYYLTLYNESYPMPAMPEGVEEGIVAGLYRYAAAPETGGPRARLLGSGPALLTALDARRVLAERYGVAAEVWSATSYKALREDALSAERWNRLHPGEPARVPYVTRALAGPEPVIAVSDFTSLVPDQVARFVSAPYTVLGTDGFGLSDTREALRRHFEVDAAHVALTVLDALARSGQLDHSVVAKAVSDLDIDAQAMDPHFG
jgi:pyruvate dehydrogenase E1 component